MWLPYLPVSVALVAFAVRFWPSQRGDAFIFAAGMVISVAVLVRQLLVLDRRRRLLDAVADAAFRDTLTGLANRRLFDERLAHAAQLHHRLDCPAERVEHQGRRLQDCQRHLGLYGQRCVATQRR